MLVQCSAILVFQGKNPDFNYTPPRMLQLSGSEFAAPVSTRYPFAESTFLETQ